MNIDINPKVLVWAREESGVDIDDVVKKIRINQDILSKWESDGKSVSFRKLELIAKIYKRQTAIFFLPEIPKKTKKPKDYRNLGSKDKLSPETMLAIRRTERYLSVARDISNKEYWDKQYQWLDNFTDIKDIEKKVTILKKILGVDTSKGSTCDTQLAFRNWRKLIEQKLGIFTFQFPMPVSELDGFSYIDDGFPYAIVLNSKEQPARKIFTIFHEIAHILNKDDGICKTDASTNNIQVELECNTFSGKLLVPSEVLINSSNVEEIFEFGRLFNVSGEVYLRRLFEEGFVSKDNFFELLNEVKNYSKNLIPKVKKGEFRLSPINISKSTRGNKFFDFVNDALANNRMSHSMASDLLGLRVGRL